MTANWENT